MRCGFWGIEESHVSEYNPFDVAPIPIPSAGDEKHAAKPAPTVDAESSEPSPLTAPEVPAQPLNAEVQAPGQLHYAPPPPGSPRPSDPAPPGRAPLAGQPASPPGVPAPPPYYSNPNARPPSYGQAPSSPPQAASAAQAPPMLDPNGRFDLAGNPVPSQPAMGGPGVAPPPPGGEAVRYDLAGNPLPAQSHAPPAPAAPPGPYGYSPGPAPAYGQPPSNQEYVPPQHSFRPSAPTGPMVPAGMEEAMTAGANWMIGIVLLTLASVWLNKLTFPIMMPYISYAAISGVIVTAMTFGFLFHNYTSAALLATLGLMPLALLAVLGYKRQAWVFVIAMIVYGIDIPVTIITWLLHFSPWGIILGTAWHSFVFQRMFAAFTAAREINATMAGRRV